MKKERIFEMRTKKFGFTLAGAKAGFTLAEVLITLGIIGVVAAMTIPTLISNTNSAKFKSQYKKTLSTLNQAGLMGTAQYDLDWASATAADNECDPNKEASFCALLKGTLSGATYHTAADDIKMPDGTSKYTPTAPTGIPTALHYFRLADGSIVAYPSGATTCTTANTSTDNITTIAKTCGGFIDVNGPTLPNREVKCSKTAVAVASSVGDCVVRNNAADMGDIFPVVFHDGTVEPVTNAARYVLNQAK